MSRTERFFRIALRVASVLSILCVLGFLATMLHARHEINLTESVVAAQSTMLARQGTLYYSLKDYPYTVCAYMPVFYFLEAALVRVGLPANLGGRLISFSAMAAACLLCWRLVLLYTGNRYAAWLAVVLASSSLPLLMWGTTGVVDPLAVTFSLAAFYQFSRFYVRNEPTLWWGGLFAFAAFFTKQTMVAAPAAIFILLLFKNRKIALVFGAALRRVDRSGSIRHQRGAQRTLLREHRLCQHQPLRYRQADSARAVYRTRNWRPDRHVRRHSAAARARSGNRPVLVYFGFASALLCVMAAKVGSDSNYHIEPTLLLIVCTSVGLVELNFFELVFQNSKSWITLLQATLGIFLVMNYRVIVPEVITRIWRESQFRSEMAAEEPYLRNAQGRIFAADIDPVVQALGRLDVEPVIYQLMIKAGRIDPEPLRRDLAQSAIRLVILYEDIDHPIPDQSLEIARLSPEQTMEVRKHYHLVEHIPGPYLGGIYIYQPLAADSKGAP